MRTKRRQNEHRRYTVHTATAPYSCMVCGGVIAPGDQYTRRRYRTTKGDHVTLRKCSRCVPIKESK